ncbi:MAG: Hpt domain-containing protein, partial [Pseudomonadota bacterium]
ETDMIDWNRVRLLREDVGADEFDDVFALFCEEVRGALDDLGQLSQAHDIEGKLHFIKGATLLLGFTDLSDVCADGEAKAAQGDVDTLDVTVLRTLFAASCAAFEGARSAELP